MVTGQLSLEFLIYASLSIIAISGALLIYVRYSNAVSERIGIAYVEGFASAINSRIGYYSSEFSAYVPASICNSIVNNSIRYDSSNFKIGANVVLDGYVCNNTGRIVEMSMNYIGNGTYVIG